MADSAVQAAVAEEPPNGTKAGVRCKVKDLSLGDLVVVQGFDGPKTVQAATKVRTGPDSGKLEVQLVGADDSVESARFNPDEEVTVVGKSAVRANASKTSGKKAPGKGRAKPKTERKAKPTKAPLTRR
jgi:hypothetical protein